MGYRRSPGLGALIAAAMLGGGAFGPATTSGVNVQATTGGSSIDRAPLSQRSMFDTVIKAVGRGGFPRPQRHSYYSGNSISCAEQKRRARKARNRCRHKKVCGMRGRSA